MLDNKDFVDRLLVKLAYKPNRFKSLFSNSVIFKRKSLHPEMYQDIYNFWLNNSISKVEATSSIFQNISFCNSVNLSQIKISWKKKNLSKI